MPPATSALGVLRQLNRLTLSRCPGAEKRTVVFSKMAKAPVAEVTLICAAAAVVPSRIEQLTKRIVLLLAPSRIDPADAPLPALKMMP